MRRCRHCPHSNSKHLQQYEDYDDPRPCQHEGCKCENYEEEEEQQAETD